MSRWFWPVVILLICMPVVLLATGVPLPWLTDRPTLPRPQPLPAGDQELAWIHTTTNSATWERFVSGVVRAQMSVPGLRVDDSNAFQDSTTAMPELVLSMPGRSGNLRIRWYKIRTDVTAADWIHALAQRDPAPLAIIGGGSTDRAVDLANALEAETQWNGDRPLLLITTATADVVASADDRPGALPSRRLVDLYDHRTFRFCFSNRQMAEAVLDFTWQVPELAPEPVGLRARQAIGSGWVRLGSDGWPRSYRPHVLSVLWDDDPYSTDLHRQFTESIRELAGGEDRVSFSHQFHIPFSVGGFLGPNLYEARTAESLAQQLRESPTQRSLLVVPAVTQPARRMLRAISEASPLAAQRLVVVTGDGIPVNTVFRDAEFAWPGSSISMPIVMFTHNNPVGWDTPAQPAPPGYSLAPPNSTEEALHFRDLARIVAEASFLPSEGNAPGPLVNRADQLLARLHGRRPAFFDDNGERLGGTGEYVVVVMPRREAEPHDQPPQIAVWRREEDRRWTPVRTLNIDPRKFPQLVEAP